MSTTVQKINHPLPIGTIVLYPKGVDSYYIKKVQGKLAIVIEIGNNKSWSKAQSYIVNIPGVIHPDTGLCEWSTVLDDNVIVFSRENKLIKFIMGIK